MALSIWTVMATSTSNMNGTCVEQLHVSIWNTHACVISSMVAAYLVDLLHLDLLLFKCFQSCFLLALIHASASSLLQHAQDLRRLHVQHLCPKRVHATPILFLPCSDTCKWLLPAKWRLTLVILPCMIRKCGLFTFSWTEWNRF